MYQDIGLGFLLIQGGVLLQRTRISALGFCSYRVVVYYNIPGYRPWVSAHTGWWFITTYQDISLRFLLIQGGGLLQCTRISALGFCSYRVVVYYNVPGYRP